MCAPPMALLMAGYWSRGESLYDNARMDEASSEVVILTHKNPIDFLSAAPLTHLIYQLIKTGTSAIKSNIARIALESIDALGLIYKDKYAQEKSHLAELTRKAISLAKGIESDAENIRLLGEGWTGAEAWAVALYCVVRHAGSVQDAIIAAVNHSGDSASTGSICGSIMGAVYGYEAIKRQRLFCPEGKELEQTLELSNIILALADDLYTSCILGGECYDPIDTSEKRQWYERYCEMKPAGIHMG